MGAAMYNAVAQKMEWKTISAGAVGVRRKRHQLEVDMGTHGEAAFANTHLMQHKRSAPSAPMLYWTMDGWTVELLYQKTETTAVVKKRAVKNWDGVHHKEVADSTVTTYHNRLTAVIVLDPCEKYPIGYAIGRQENNDLIKEALRNALRHTQELFGAMHRPQQLQCDNYHIGSLKSLYGVAADKVTPARVRNAKAKVIEPYNKFLNKNYCQMLPNWSGFGMESRRENQPNKEALIATRKSFPDEEGCRRQIVWMLESERAKKRDAYISRWAGVSAEMRLPMNAENYLYHFGERTNKSSLLEGQGLTPTIAGRERFYDCFDAGFRRNYGVQWFVHYDPQDLSRALAASEDGSLKFMLENKHVQPMAMAERREGDSAARKRVDDYNNNLVMDTRNKIKCAREQSVIGASLSPELEILERICLPDSAGQHKDRRNQLRNDISVGEIEHLLADSPPKLLKNKAYREQEEEVEEMVYAMY